MPVPEFILQLRKHVGQDLLWLSGVTAVVTDDAGRVLVTRRSDDGRWALPSGIPEPGEQLGQACAREVLEETGVDVRVERLVSIWTLPPQTYPNGDVCQFIDHTFACTATGGEAHIADDESLAVEWFPRDALPDLDPRQLLALERAADTGAPTWFAR